MVAKQSRSAHPATGPSIHPAGCAASSHRAASTAAPSSEHAAWASSSQHVAINEKRTRSGSATPPQVPAPNPRVPNGAWRLATHAPLGRLTVRMQAMVAVSSLLSGTQTSPFKKHVLPVRSHKNTTDLIPAKDRVYYTAQDFWTTWTNFSDPAPTRSVSKSLDVVTFLTLDLSP